MGSKQDALIEKTVKAMVKQFGEGAAMTLTKAFAPETVRGFIPTGILALDWAIGRPGIPVGRITEIAGPYGSCKSTVIAHTIGAAQKAGMACILIDAEHSYDSSWSRRFGVNPETLILIQPPHLQGLFDRTIAAIKILKEEQSDIPVFVAVDSVSAVPTAEELEEEDSTSGKQRAAHAKVISEGLRKAGELIWDQNVSLLFVSQLKDNPGVMYGANKSKIGGHAIEFHAGLMIELRRAGQIKNSDGKVTGQTVQVKVIKNKFVPPFRESTFTLDYEKGIGHKEMLIDFLSEPEYGINMIKKSGGWYEFQGAKYHKEDLADKLDESMIQEVYRAMKLLPPYDRQDSKPVSKQELTINEEEFLKPEPGVVKSESKLIGESSKLTPEQHINAAVPIGVPESRPTPTIVSLKDLT